MSKKKDNSNANLHMLVDITYTASFLDCKISKILKAHGLTHIQYNILRVLRGAQPEPLSINEIKNRIVFANSDMTRLLDRLVKKNLVFRNTDPNNRRKVNVSISDEGLKLLEEVFPDLENGLLNFYKKEVTSEEAILVSDVLKKIRI